MSRTCYFLASGHFRLPGPDEFKSKFLGLLGEMSALGYRFCTDYLLPDITLSLTEGDNAWDQVQPGDAVIILANTGDPAYRVRLDSLAEYARERGVEPYECLMP